MGLTEKKCVPCEKGTPPLEEEQIKKLLKEIPKWILKEDFIIAAKIDAVSR